MPAADRAISVENKESDVKNVALTNTKTKLDLTICNGDFRKPSPIAPAKLTILSCLHQLFMIIFTFCSQKTQFYLQINQIYLQNIAYFCH